MGWSGLEKGDSAWDRRKVAMQAWVPCHICHPCPPCHLGKVAPRCGSGVIKAQSIAEGLREDECARL